MTSQREKASRPPGVAPSFPARSNGRDGGRRPRLPVLRRHLATAGVLAGLFLLAASSGALDLARWRRIEIPETGSYAWRYLPASLDPARPAPVVVFLHGAGGAPEDYRSFVEEGAELARAIVLLPRSGGVGWGDSQDAETIASGLERLAAERELDPERTAIAGHSAGGAYAYLLAYGPDAPYNAVFTLAAPFYAVPALPPGDIAPPIRMFYGGDDPNYTGGAAAALVAQWERLGVPWEEEVRPGFPHNDWPEDAMLRGFAFLAAHPRPALGGPRKPDCPGACVPSPDRLCLDACRFRIEVSWRDGAGHAGPGHVVPDAAEDSGLFWFFSPDNWELLVKVLDGCAVNGHYWVFSAAPTDVAYELVVTDTLSGVSARYSNVLGTPSPARIDTAALAVCP